MGDRVLVTFTDDGETFTPAIYMHWSGTEAADIIRKAQPRLRKGDAGYAAARFCGECHLTTREYSTGLGLVDAPSPTTEGFSWDEYSHGDAGVYVVNVTTGAVSAHGGYGEPFQMDPVKFHNC